MSAFSTLISLEKSCFGNVFMGYCWEGTGSINDHFAEFVDSLILLSMVHRGSTRGQNFCIYSEFLSFLGSNGRISILSLLSEGQFYPIYKAEGSSPLKK